MILPFKKEHERKHAMWIRQMGLFWMQFVFFYYLFWEGHGEHKEKEGSCRLSCLTKW